MKYELRHVDTCSPGYFQGSPHQIFSIPYCSDIDIEGELKQAIEAEGAIVEERFEPHAAMMALKEYVRNEDWWDMMRHLREASPSDEIDEGYEEFAPRMYYELRPVE